MSMQDYSFADHGIVLNGLVDADILEELAEDGTIEAQFSFTGDALPLKDNGCPDWSGAYSLYDESIYYVPLPKSPQFFKAVYKDMDALVEDMRERYRVTRNGDKRLPVLSAKKMRGLLRYICGTYYG